MFSNQQITDLPQHKSIAFSPLADKALLHAQLSWLTFFIPLSVILAAVCYLNEGVANAAQQYLFFGMPVLLILAMVYNFINIRLQGVAMREHDIAFKKGVIWQHMTILPLARVQHIEIHRGPIERQLGLASLKLYSAGGMSADLQISGLTHNVCKNMRQFVQNYRQDEVIEQAEAINE